MFLIEKIFQSYNFSSVIKAKVHNTLKSPINDTTDSDLFLLASRGCEILQFKIAQSSQQEQSYSLIASLKLPNFITGLHVIPQQSEEQASYVIILCENNQILIVNFYNEMEGEQIILRDQQIHSFQLQCMISWNQYLDFHVNHNCIFIQHSNSQFIIIPYVMNNGIPDFQMNFTSYTKGFKSLQILPYNLRQKVSELENSFSLVVFHTDNKQEINISQTLAISDAPIQLSTMQPIIKLQNSMFWRAFVVFQGIVFHTDKKLILLYHSTSRYVELMDDLFCTPRQLLEINENEFLFQNGFERELFLVNLKGEVKVESLGVHSYAEKMELIYENVVFISSTLDDSQIIYLNGNKVQKVVNLQNVGKITHISKNQSNIQITSCISRYSAYGVSKQVKMTELKRTQEFDKPHTFKNSKIISQISNQKIIKTKDYGQFIIALSEANQLLIIKDDAVMQQYDFVESISDFDANDDDIFVSFWFTSQITMINLRDFKTMKYIVMDDKGIYNLSPINFSGSNSTTVNGMICFQKDCLLIANLKNQLQILYFHDSLIQKTYNFDSLFVKFFDCPKHIIAVYIDKIIVLIKSSLRNQQPHYFQINSTNVYDACVIENENSYQLSTMSVNSNKRVIYSLQDFNYKQSIGVQISTTLQDELNQNIKFQEQSGDLIFMVKNQIVFDHNNKTHVISDLQQAQYRFKEVQSQQRQSILLVCKHNTHYWQNTLIQSQTLNKTQTYVFKIQKIDQYILLYQAGRNYDEIKKGFLKIMILSPIGTFIDEQFYPLSDAVLDIGIQGQGKVWLLTEQKTILVNYLNQEEKFSKLQTLLTVIDPDIIPTHIEVRQNEFLIYDDIKAMSIYTYNPSKVVRQIYQIFDGLNSIIKFMGDYILRTSYDHKIYIYQKKQNKNYQSLKKIGFGELFEDILSIQTNDYDMTFLIGTKQGSIYSGILLKNDKIEAIIEVQDQVKQLKKQKEIKQTMMEEEKIQTLKEEKLKLLQEEKLKLLKAESEPMPELEETIFVKVLSENIQDKSKPKNNQLLYLQKLFHKKLEAIENSFFSYNDLLNITKDKEFQEIFEQGSVQSFKNVTDFQDQMQQLKNLVN